MNAPTLPGATLDRRTRFERRLLVTRLHQRYLTRVTERDRAVAAALPIDGMVGDALRPPSYVWARTRIERRAATPIASAIPTG